MKPGKHQRKKQRCQDLCWKVQDLTKTFRLVSSLVSSKKLLCTVKAKKKNKNIQQRTLASFVTIPLY